MSRQRVAIAVGVLVAIVTLVLIVQAPSQDNANAASSHNNSDNTAWRTAQLTDVKNGQTFTISQFDKPVLLESFAVWCPTCTQQQKEIQKLHNEIGGAVVSVSLDTDPNEGEQKVLNHMKEHGFNWRYAVAPEQMTKSLIDDFGSQVVAAPQSPTILICENDRTRFLPSGLKTANELKNEIEQGC